jgi:hypothetical protein
LAVELYEIWSLISNHQLDLRIPTAKVRTIPSIFGYVRGRSYLEPVATIRLASGLEFSRAEKGRNNQGF